MTKKTIKCKACQDKGYYTQLVGESGSDDFGGEGYVIDPHIQKFPCPKCIRIENGHKEDCDFVNSDQGVCNCFQPEQKECWRCNLGEPKEFHVCEPNPSKCEHSHEPSSCKHCRPQPEAQMEQKVVDALFNQQIDKIKKTIYPISGFASSIPPEQKECWRCNLGEPKEFHGCEPYPQPTDGLIEGWEKRLLALWPEDVEIDKRSFPAIRTLLAEQKKKTREDTIDEVLRALELNDDHEVPKIVIKALKSKKQ